MPKCVNGLPWWLNRQQETQVQSLGQDDPQEKGMATHFSILPWKIPWTEEPGRLQSMGSNRVRRDQSELAHMHTQGTKIPQAAQYGQKKKMIGND